MRVIAFEIDLRIASDIGSELVPRDEAQISVRALVANKVFLALQNGVQDHGDSLNLGAIAVFCRLDIFGMVFIEPGTALISVELMAVGLQVDLPGCLAKVRALA